MAIRGPATVLHPALMRLEIIADAYLSVNTAVQVAAPMLLEAGQGLRHEILRRVRSNYRELRDAVARFPPCQLLRAEGGWSAVLRIPHTIAEDERVIRLLEDSRVLVHPGFFFDFPRDGYLVVSLITRPDVFRSATSRVLHAVCG
jgi:aspartate/methionine/tyrosine aminotransferase